MRKIVLVIAVLAVFFSVFTGVSADCGKDHGSVIISDASAVVKVGETVTLKAITPKHGSSYSDHWTHALKSSAILDAATGNYVSEALFTAKEPGVYTIRYCISMSAGQSNTYFTSEAEVVIKVTQAITVAGADIRNLTVNPVYRADGSISHYSASGTVYALWSDGSATPYSSIFFFFGPEETTKTLNVTLDIDGTPYTYPVTVSR